MTNDKIPPKFLKLLKSVKAKRPRTVIEHILKHGQITTEELKDVYGYNHPPRAIRDVREQGIPIKSRRVSDSDGRKIAAYEFGNPSEVRNAQLSGRTAFSNQLKSELIASQGSRCNIYLEIFKERELQIDHRVPFEIAGDEGDLSDVASDYMLLCASANRAKSWSCEHCKNWDVRDIDTCKTCYWAYPEAYQHIATRDIRRLDILWTEDEVTDFEKLEAEATKSSEDIPNYVKNVLRNHLKKKE